MTVVTELDLPFVDLFAPEAEDTFHDQMAELRRQGHWLIRTPLGVSIIDYDAVRDLQHDPRLRPLGTNLFEMQGVTEGPMYERFARSIISREGPEHTRLRRLVSRAFTPRAVDRHRPMMRAWVDERARAMAEQGGGDLVADLAEAYPIAVICQLVGAPEEDWPKFSAWATDVFRLFNMNLGRDLPVIEAAEARMDAYVADLIEQRRAQPPRPDLISDLLRVEEEGDRLSGEELTDMVNSLILAGTDTTRNQLGLTVLALARHPEQWERLVDDPGLVPRAVEEGLRYAPAAAATPRIAREDVVFRGHTIPAGSFVSLISSAANRDPDHVRCPMDLDVTVDRGSWQVLTFGAGPHYCLGANLARAELQEALGVLVRRWRRIELAGEPVMKPFIGVYGPQELPLRIEAA